MSYRFICCWPLDWRRACVSNTVTNLSIVFLFNLFPFCKCSKCVVRHLGKAPTSRRNVFKFPFKIDKYLWHGFICCWPLEGRRACVSNTVTNLSIVFLFNLFPFCKCSKCVVRHLRKAPPSPRNVLKFPLKIDKYLWHGFNCCWPLEGRRACVSNSATNLNIVGFPFLQVF